MCLLLDAVVRAARYGTGLEGSNSCAVRPLPRLAPRLAPVILTLVMFAGVPGVAAQSATETLAPQQEPSAGKRIASFLAGAAAGLGIHESGHVLADLAMGERPTLRRVEFHGVPFFAVTHRGGLPRRQEFTISSAGFWVQHVENEWLLRRRPHLRRERAPFAKGVLAFNLLTSAAYAAAAFGRTGPLERDTRGMAASGRVDERVIGALVLAPAVFDAWRYYQPRRRAPAWASRTLKVGMVLMVVR